MNSPRYQAQLAEERKALGLETGAIAQESMFGEGFDGILATDGALEEPVMEVEVVKTPAQLLVEKIEKSKGLRK